MIKVALLTLFTLFPAAAMACEFGPDGYASSPFPTPAIVLAVVLLSVGLEVLFGIGSALYLFLMSRRYELRLLRGVEYWFASVALASFAGAIGAFAASYIQHLSEAVAVTFAIAFPLVPVVLLFNQLRRRLQFEQVSRG